VSISAYIIEYTITDEPT
jgi:galacturan 1,4-alpha-galacturonidase